MLSRLTQCAGFWNASPVWKVFLLLFTCLHDSLSTHPRLPRFPPSRVDLASATAQPTRDILVTRRPDGDSVFSGFGKVWGGRLCACMGAPVHVRVPWWVRWGYACFRCMHLNCGVGCCLTALPSPTPCAGARRLGTALQAALRRQSRPASSHFSFFTLLSQHD